MSNPRTRPTVSTAQYEFSHGKRPRGEGTWGFTTETGELFWADHGPYVTAKRQALIWALAFGHSRLEVAP